VSEISKTMGTQRPASKKREMNKIAYIFLKVVSKFQKRGMFLRSKVEIG
jgi:hypothetical protein